ncbi:MAG: hypothetical protein IV086_05935 [Hyphomonadaceae bacterium]|nr:MAG: hypothetical protein FD160_2064 [Caulobacteraceae bacterium]MBT9445219.1 hypothetical protein [Hyphomonadaceae bacterium]TPW07312.1 MAG: hypothetical protein FD124_1267 [Alphaproteobacteria bacterium]
MLRALALVVLLALAAPAPVLASGPGGGGEKSGEAESARAMDVMNLIVPVVRGGRLVNYVFINARIQLTPGTDIWRARDKGHFLRDALLKAVHRQPVVDATHDDAINTPAAQALIASVARQVLGPNSVRSVEIMSTSSLKQGRSARS